MPTMRTLAVIPARYASTRFPGKPLVLIQGKSMIQRVYEQAQSAGIFDHIIIATDNEKIYHHAQGFGADVMMTAATHQSGTDRIGEVIQRLTDTYAIVFNIQGDEPFIQPEQLRLLHTAFADPQTSIATLVKRITNTDDIQNPNCVKVVFTKKWASTIFFTQSHSICAQYH